MKLHIKLFALFAFLAVGILQLFAQAGQNGDARVGQTVTMTPLVNVGTLPMQYSWTKDGVALGGTQTTTATSLSPTTFAPLVLPNVQPANAGTYVITISNTAGSTQATAVIRVWAVVTITTQPSSLTLMVGAPASFSVVATGGSTYQWTKNGAAISGATASTYTIPAVSVADAGTYAVTVSNPASSAQSANVLLTVNTPVAPVINSLNIQIN